jgi:hypothetical protein
MHASTSEPHVVPDQLDAQEQAKPFTLSVQVPPLAHGDDVHSLSLTSQL